MTLKEYLSSNDAHMNSKEILKKLVSFPEEMPVSVLKAGPGFCLIREGERCDKVHILVQGSLRVISDGFSYGSSYALSCFNDIYVLGEYELFGGAERYVASVTTTTDAIFLILDYSDYLEWLKSSTDIMFARARMVVGALLGDITEERRNLFESSDERLKSYLALCYEKSCPDKKATVTLPSTRLIISEDTGFCIRTVNRALKRLATAEVISIYKGKIKISPAQYKQLLATKNRN